MIVKCHTQILKYGPYPKTKDITISATGKAKGKKFSSETKTISADDLKIIRL